MQGGGVIQTREMTLINQILIMDVKMETVNMMKKASDTKVGINNKKIQQKIWAYFKSNQYDQAIRFIKSKLRLEPRNHWLLTRLGTAYYEKHEYKKALIYCKRALQIKLNCPLALWDYAGTISSLGRKKEAINIWAKIINRGITRIAYDECGEGLIFAKSLINDCRYRIGLDYFDSKEPELAKKFLNEYLRNRAKKVKSIYLKSDAINRLKKLGVKKQ